MAEPVENTGGLLVELSRPISSDEEAKIATFMKVRNIDRPTAMKFLMGRKMDVDRAHLLLTNYQRTILERHFENITVTDVAKELKTGKMYIPGTCDRNMAQLMVIDGRKHDPAAFTYDDTMRLAFFMGQKVTERPLVWEHGLTLIVNMSGFTWTQWDMSLNRQILGLFTDNIPARVKNILLFDAPWWISTLVRIVSPFLKPKMRERLQLCDKDSIQNWIEAKNLPIQFGGELEYDHEAFMTRCIEDIGEDQFRHKLHLDERGREITAVPIEELVDVLPDSALAKKIDLEPARKEALEQERAEAVALLEERIEMLKESSKHNRVGEHKDFFHLLRYRATRLSLDLSMLLQQPQPNMSESHSSKSATDSSIAETREENYKRIKKDIEANNGMPYLLSVDPSSDDKHEVKKVEQKTVNPTKSPEVINEDLEEKRRRAAGTRRPVAFSESKPVIKTSIEPLIIDSSSSNLACEEEVPAIVIEEVKPAQERLEQEISAPEPSDHTSPVPQEHSPSIPSEVPSEPAASPTPHRRGRAGRAARVKPIDSSFMPPVLPPESKDAIERSASPRPNSDNSKAGKNFAAPPPITNRDSVTSLRPISTAVTSPRDSMASLRPISTVSDVHRTSMTSLAPVDVTVKDAEPEPLGPIEEGMEGMISTMSGNRRRTRKRSDDANARRQVHIGGSPNRLA